LVFFRFGVAPARRLITILAVAAFAGGAGGAYADIDPASDVLPLQDVFLPYNPKVCPQLSTALRKLTARSKEAGYPVKVAVIASKRDLGGASTLFGDPKAYARFLAQELVTYAPDFGTTYGNPALLVAMPAGFGLDHGGAKAEKVMEGLSVSSFKPNDLARASLSAIPKLARAEGHRVALPKVRPGCSSSGGGTSVLFFIAPFALLLLVGLLAGSRRRPDQANPERYEAP
jgi:MYXO-CTERM domain-containing protein